MAELSRSSYLEKNVGSFPEEIVVAGKRYEKVDDLRYGTNPHQPAAYYRPVGEKGVIGGMEILKNGKNGLSQTNLEDISGALNIVKFFSGVPACAVMKHVNPSGAAIACPGETLCDVYLKARDADARAAFGSVIAFNVEVDAETAKAIMSTFVECVVAPAFTDEALTVFHDSETFKLNKHVRIIRCGNPDLLPKYCSDAAQAVDTVKVLTDGSLIVAAPLLTSLTDIADLKPAQGENSRCGKQISSVLCTEEQKRDLLFNYKRGCRK